MNRLQAGVRRRRAAAAAAAAEAAAAEEEAADADEEEEVLLSYGRPACTCHVWAGVPDCQMMLLLLAWQFATNGRLMLVCGCFSHRCVWRHMSDREKQSNQQHTLTINLPTSPVLLPARARQMTGVLEGPSVLATCGVRHGRPNAMCSLLGSLKEM